MSDSLTFMIMGGVAIFGLMATFIYYLARYYFRKLDDKLAPRLKTPVEPSTGPSSHAPPTHRPSHRQGQR